MCQSYVPVKKFVDPPTMSTSDVMHYNHAHIVMPATEIAEPERSLMPRILDAPVSVGGLE
jgi:hypothetical protein